MGVTLLALMPYGTHDMNLSTVIVNSIAHGLAVDCQAFIDYAVLGIPGLEGLVQFHGVNSNKDITYGAFAWDAVLSMTEVTAESGASCG